MQLVLSTKEEPLTRFVSYVLSLCCRSPVYNEHGEVARVGITYRFIMSVSTTTGKNPVQGIFQTGHGFPDTERAMCLQRMEAA